MAVRSWQIRCTGPTICRQVVYIYLFLILCALVVAMLAADSIDLSIESHHCDVVTRIGKWRCPRPAGAAVYI